MTFGPLPIPQLKYTNITVIYIYTLDKFVTGFVKRSLPHTSNSMNLEDCSLCFKVHTNLKFSPSINIMLVLTTVQISRHWLFYSIWSYEWSKLVNWMCVEEPFSQIWSHLWLEIIEVLQFWDLVLNFLGWRIEHKACLKSFWKKHGIKN